MAFVKRNKSPTPAIAIGTLNPKVGAPNAAATFSFGSNDEVAHLPVLEVAPLNVASWIANDF